MVHLSDRAVALLEAVRLRTAKHGHLGQPLRVQLEGIVDIGTYDFDSNAPSQRDSQIQNYLPLDRVQRDPWLSRGIQRASAPTRRTYNRFARQFDSFRKEVQEHPELFLKKVEKRRSSMRFFEGLKSSDPLPVCAKRASLLQGDSVGACGGGAGSRRGSLAVPCRDTCAPSVAASGSRSASVHNGRGGDGDAGDASDTSGASCGATGKELDAVEKAAECAELKRADSASTCAGSSGDGVPVDGASRHSACCVASEPRRPPPSPSELLSDFDEEPVDRGSDDKGSVGAVGATRVHSFVGDFGFDFEVADEAVALRTRRDFVGSAGGAGSRKPSGAKGLRSSALGLPPVACGGGFSPPLRLGWEPLPGSSWHFHPKVLSWLFEPAEGVYFHIESETLWREEERPERAAELHLEQVACVVGGQRDAVLGGA